MDTEYPNVELEVPFSILLHAQFVGGADVIAAVAQALVSVEAQMWGAAMAADERRSM